MKGEQLVGEKENVLNALESGESIATEKSDLQKDTESQDKALDIGEGKEAHREELVRAEDILKIVEMTKENLRKYAHSRLGKKLDLNKRLKMLRLEVVTLVKNKLKLPQDVDSSNVTKKPTSNAKEEAEFVFNPANRRVFEWTELFAKRTDLIECWLVDKDGKRL